MSSNSLPGFRDFYPEELARRAHIFRAWRAVARKYGFEEYDGPPLEPLELYTRKSGEEIVGQLYNFQDKGGREISLRPEMTPTLARMVAARANAMRKPVRWFAMPQLFRYERQQRGQDHLAQSGLCHDVHALPVVRGFLSGEDAGEGLDLAADLTHDGTGGIPHGIHGKGGE